MCGRFSLLADLSSVIEAFAIDKVEASFHPNSNFSPGQEIYAVINDGINKLVAFKWGLIPPWASDPSIGKKLFNARAETIRIKPSFKNAFFKRRCLIPAQGFYEWPKKGTEKKGPLFFFLKNRPLFGLAGIYESWRSPENKIIFTCSIITTASNSLIKPYHDRMPVIVPPNEEKRWLERGEYDLLKPYPPDEMSFGQP